MFIAEGGELNPWVEGLRPSAITGLCHLSIPLSLVVLIYLFVCFICFQQVEVGLAFSIGPLHSGPFVLGRSKFIDRNRPGLLRSELRSRRTINR